MCLVGVFCIAGIPFHCYCAGALGKDMEEFLLCLTLDPIVPVMTLMPVRPFSICTIFEEALIGFLHSITEGSNYRFTDIEPSQLGGLFFSDGGIGHSSNCLGKLHGSHIIQVSV